MINLTNKAVEKLKGFITPGEVVRLAVQGGGCNGFQYKFGVSPREDCFDDDYIIEKDGVSMHIDVFSHVYLENVEIDFEDTTFQPAFKIRNPDVKQTCGCGNSFS
jgi:iron-sulfur cluster assembly accessory protein